MIKSPVQTHVESGLVKWAHNDLVPGADVRDFLLDLLLLIKPVEKFEGMTKIEPIIPVLSGA